MGTFGLDSCIIRSNGARVGLSYYPALLIDLNFLSKYRFSDRSCLQAANRDGRLVWQERSQRTRLLDFEPTLRELRGMTWQARTVISSCTHR